MIELENLRKIYPGRRGKPPTVALESFETRIEDGEFVTVVGPSGCGRTTLLNLVAGFEQPDAGRIALDGVEVHGPGADRAVVFQQPSLYPWLTVWENIAFGLRLQGRRQAEEAAVRRIIGIMGLEGFERHAPYELSGGMQQRVAIARALIVQPKILLMDEPFGALDAQTRGEMQAFLLSLWRKVHPTVLFITHDVEEAILLGDRVLVLTPRPGRLSRELHVDLSRPRHYQMALTTRFNELKREVLAVLRPEAVREEADGA